MKLSKRLQNLGESATLLMASKSRELKEQGIDIISFSLGEPDFDTPDYIKDAAKIAIDEGYTSYPPVNGYADLREAICLKLKRDNDLHYKPEQIVVSTGAKQSLANIIYALVDHGDDVVIPAPYWVTYPEQVALAGGNVITFETTVEADYKFTANQLQEAITPHTKLLIFSSPSNPSGSTFTKQELAEIAIVIKNNPHVMVISDEMYEIISFGEKPTSLAHFEEIKEQVIVVNGVSKAFAMTGWRLGYMAGPQWIADACKKFQGQITSGANTIAQRAALKAINESPSLVQYMVDSFEKRRDLMLELMKDIPGLKTNIPTGAFYILPDVSAYFGKTNGTVTIHTAQDFAMYLLEYSHVAVVDGKAFGLPKCIRISYANSEHQIREGMNRIKNALAKLY